MDLKQIEKLMAAMEESRIKRIVLKREDYEIEIERETVSSAPPPQQTYAPLPQITPQATANLESKSIPTPTALATNEHKEKAGSLYVTSPMVGTFYASPSPEDPQFVKPGDTISEDSVVCIIEAMKVMNEVKAGVKGVVAEVLVKNGEPVEFGTHIIRVTPA